MRRDTLLARLAALLDDDRLFVETTRRIRRVAWGSGFS
jgi:hypothetical protein